jgi:6,7-dimethyl-8-ribityllumazine synthase
VSEFEADDRADVDAPEEEDAGLEEPAAEPEDEVADGDTPDPSDPFESWPAAESSATIQESPADGASVEHVRGEVEVPDGYSVLEGTPLGEHRSVGIVVSRFNGGLTNRLLARALEALQDAGVEKESVTIVPVPGAFELPLAAMALAKTRRYACIVALGAIVRGETPHFEYVAGESARGLAAASAEFEVPLGFGLLTCDTMAQAEARAGGAHGNKGWDAALAALEMADLLDRVDTPDAG